MDIYRAQFGARLQAALDQAGRSQTELAEGVDVKDSTVSRWANGHDFPKPSTLLRIAKFLNVTTESLLGTASRPQAPSNRPNSRDLKQMIEGDGHSLPNAPLAQVLAEFANVAPAIRASVLAVLYNDKTIAAPYLQRDKAQSKSKIR